MHKLFLMNNKNELCDEPESMDLGRMASNCTLRNSMKAYQEQKLMTSNKNNKLDEEKAEEAQKTKKESIHSNILLVNYRLRHNQSVELNGNDNGKKDFMVSEIVIPKLEFDIIQSPSSKTISNKKSKLKKKCNKLSILIAALVIIILTTIGFIIIAIVKISKTKK